MAHTHAEGTGGTPRTPLGYGSPHSELRQIYGAFAGVSEALMMQGVDNAIIHQVRAGVRRDLHAFLDRGPAVGYPGAVGPPYATDLPDEKKLELALRLFDRLLGVAADFSETEHTYVVARQVVAWLDF